MKNLLCCCFTVCCFFLFVVHPAYADNGLVRITDHVYAYVDSNEASPANSFGANAGIIIGEKEIAVIDTLVSSKEAKRFIRDIRKISDKPIKYVVNTHYHLDHSFGNSEFDKLGATIISHENCGDEMRLKAAEGLAGAENYGLTPEDMAGTEIAYPDVTFTDQLQLDLGDVKVNLIYVTSSHSKGSILVHVPEEKVVFAGDILFTDFHPYMGDGDIKGWQQTLDYLAALDADKIIPGHGPLSSKKDVADMKAYITVFDKKAREVAANWSGEPEAIVAEMKKYLPERTRGEWLIGANMQVKYLKGKSDGNN
jgi:glyoxylase-like metal-dependent hydrolase (beta-lactamase superfamily II)